MARKAQPVLPRVCIVAKRCSPLLRVAEVSSQVQVGSVGESEEGGFFNSAFKEALSSALQRNKDDAVPSEAFTNFAPVKLPPAPDNSVGEEMMGAALEASKASLARLIAMRSEIERAIERERTQVERLMFAKETAEKDAAYYRVLRSVQERTMGTIDE